MKRLFVLGCSIFALAAVAQAKEVIPKVTSSKEVVPTPAPVVEEVVVAPVTTLPWGYVSLRAGWDFWGQYDKAFQLEKDTENFGGEVGLEVYKTLSPYFDLGLGVAYQKHMDRKDNNGFGGAEFDSVPLYATAKYNLRYWDLPFTPYIKANLGYSFNFDSKDLDTPVGSVGTSVDDGMYWAAGLGAEYNNFVVDVMYGVNMAKSKFDFENDHHNRDNDYQRVTLSVGYNFNF